MTVLNPRFCSDAARLRGDDNVATAARVDYWILVELAAVWGRDALSDGVMPEPVRERLGRVTGEFPRSRLLFIRRREQRADSCMVQLVRSGRNPGVASHELPSIDDVAIFSFDQLSRAIAPIKTPLVLVCTHGQHDSCCGKRGFPLYETLRKRPDLDVWQCSHIGGDRFAANALVLPWGAYYGPVESTDADAFATSILQDQIYLEAFRGRSTMSRPVQAAETFVRRELNLRARTGLRFASRQDLDGGRVRVLLEEPGRGITHETVVEQYVHGEEILATCSSRKPGPVRQFRMVSHREISG